MKKQFVSVFALQSQITSDRLIYIEPYYNFFQNKFSSGELNNFSLNEIIGEKYEWNNSDNIS